MTGSWGVSPVPPLIAPLIATNSNNSSHTSLIFHTSMSSFDAHFKADQIRGTNSNHINHGQNDIRQLKGQEGVSAHLVHAINEHLLVFDLFTLSDFC